MVLSSFFDSARRSQNSAISHVYLATSRPRSIIFGDHKSRDFRQSLANACCIPSNRRFNPECQLSMTVFEASKYEKEE